MANLQIRGADEIRAALRAIPKELAGKELGSALMDGAQVVCDEARRLAPKGKTGNLERNIISVKDKKPWLSHMAARAVVMVRWGSRGSRSKSTADYWRFKEFGTSKMAAKPFMRPAFESKKFDALTAVFQSLSSFMEKIAKRIKR